MCANGPRGRGRESTSSSKRRARPRKVAAQSKQTQHKAPVIDLTAERVAEGTRVVEVASSPMDATAQLESDDYFEVLGLPRSASDADVKRAYRKLAVQWHPDKNRSHPRAEEVFKQISEAYEVLSDPEKRRRYESHGKQALSGSATDPHARGDDHFGFSGGFSAQHARDMFDAFFGGQDPFEAFFGGGRQRRGSSHRREARGRFGDDPFEAMGFGGMATRGFGSLGGMAMMDSFFSDGFGGVEASGGVFSTAMSSSSSTFTDRNGHVVTQKTTTTTGADGRTETVTEEYRNGKLVNSTSSASTTGSRLAGAGRMQLEGSASKASHSSDSRSFQRRASSNSRPKY
ncbi:unnamed protein product [Phytophthora fragariaefolia]|uniref:Unnamed protein product n=1 Tax=Phytophthora fragariaefolia TaxID=1490495 RepID=A0A9W6XIX1_9STRA|nr:unnamed protein product [Phytophthora fragariaefolia]